MTFKHYFIIILVAVTIASCKKESFLSGKDQITYTEFNPVPELTSVDSFTYSMEGTLPNPNDSSASYALDIDEDSNPDFQLTVKHWYAFVSPGASEVNYNYEMTISGINSTSEIATTSESSNHVYIYAPDESVDRKAKWNNNAVLTHTGGFADTYYAGINGTQFIGLRIKKGSRRHYCWLQLNRDASKHQLRILSLGYNKSNGNNIRAGQNQ